VSRCTSAPARLCGSGRVVWEEGAVGIDFDTLSERPDASAAGCWDGACFVRRDVSKLKELSQVQILLPRPENPPHEIRVSCGSRLFSPENRRAPKVPESPRTEPRVPEKSPNMFAGCSRVSSPAPAHIEILTNGKSRFGMLTEAALNFYGQKGSDDEYHSSRASKRRIRGICLRRSRSGSPRSQASRQCSST
jgi:hypothetical protein